MPYSHEKFLVDLGAKLRELRIARGWTLRYMIVNHGFHLAHWQGFEKGKGISVRSLLRICDVFGIAVEDLVAGLGLEAALEREDKFSRNDPSSEEALSDKRSQVNSDRTASRAQPANRRRKSEPQ